MPLAAVAVPDRDVRATSWWRGPRLAARLLVCYHESMSSGGCNAASIRPRRLIDPIVSLTCHGRPPE